MGFFFTFFFSAKGNKTSSKKQHILMSAVTFSTNGLWMQYFTINWVCDRFVENAAPSEMAPNLRFHCLFSLHYSKSFLSGWEAFRTQGKCIKPYKNFWKDFVVKQNLTCLKDDFWSYLNGLSRFLSSLGIWIPATGR